MFKCSFLTNLIDVLKFKTFLYKKKMLTMKYARQIARIRFLLNLYGFNNYKTKL